MLQLIRILQFEASSAGSARFIVYFATCAAVDYFYRVSITLPHNDHQGKVSLLIRLGIVQASAARVFLITFPSWPSTPQQAHRGIEKFLLAS